MKPPFPPSSRRLPCDVCQGQRFDQLSDRDRRGRPLATVVCSQCGLVSHESIPAEHELAEYYDRQYRAEYHGEWTPSAYRVIREWRRGGMLLDILRPILPVGDRIIEIGCGIGCNVKRMELAGFDACGIEPGAGFCEFSRQRLHARVERKRLEEMPRTPRFDFVLLVHVLEHLRAPTRALKHIRDLLRPGGRLYVEVPNFGAPHAAPGKLFHFAHIYNFNVASLRYAGEVAGFRAERVLVADQKNLAIVFKRCEPSHVPTRTDGYARTIQALQRHNTATYHLRPTYLAERLQRVVRHYGNRCFAKRRLARILAACDAPAKKRGDQEPVCVSSICNLSRSESSSC